MTHKLYVSLFHQGFPGLVTPHSRVLIVGFRHQQEGTSMPACLGKGTFPAALGLCRCRISPYAPGRRDPERDDPYDAGEEVWAGLTPGPPLPQRVAWAARSAQWGLSGVGGDISQLEISQCCKKCSIYCKFLTLLPLISDLDLFLGLIVIHSSAQTHLPPGLFCLRNIIGRKTGLREIWVSVAPETEGSLAQTVGLAQAWLGWPHRAHALTLGGPVWGHRRHFLDEEAEDGLANCARTGQGLSGTRATDLRDRMSKKAARQGKTSSPASLSPAISPRGCWGRGREASFQNLGCLGSKITGILIGLHGGEGPFLCDPIQLLTDFLGPRGYSSKFPFIQKIIKEQLLWAWPVLECCGKVSHY